MALTYRSPIEDVLNRFTSEEQSKVSISAVLKLASVEKRQSPYFSFAMSDLGKQKLSEAGIYLSPYSFEPHSHPICKTLENYFLYEVLPNYISNEYYMVGIKNSKVSFLKSRDRNLSCLNVLNRYVTSLDKVRYSNAFVIAHSKSSPAFTRRGELALDSPTLKTLIPEVITSRARKMFIHDEMHYWDPGQICNFLMATKPEHILATIVIPPELLINATESLNPWCYTFSIKNSGKNFLFSPDGVACEGYLQKVNCKFLLRAKSFICPDGTVYNVDLVCSKFSHHLISITRGSMLGQDFRYFNNFEAVHSIGMGLFSNKIGEYVPIDISIISKLYRYMRTLKKPDVQSCMAKMSQIVPNPTGFQIRWAEEFGNLIINSKTGNELLDKSALDVVKCFFSNLLPRRLARMVETYRNSTLNKFILELKSLEVEVQTVDITENYWEEHPRILNVSFDLTSEEVDDLFDSFTDGGKKHFLGFHTPHPYYSISKSGAFSPLLFNDALISFFIRRFVYFQDDFCKVYPSFQDVKSILKMLLRKIRRSYQILPFNDVLDALLFSTYEKHVSVMLNSTLRNVRNVIGKSLLSIAFWFLLLDKRYYMRFITYDSAQMDSTLDHLIARNAFRSFLSNAFSDISDSAFKIKNGPLYASRSQVVSAAPLLVDDSNVMIVVQDIVESSEMIEPHSSLSCDQGNRPNEVTTVVEVQTPTTVEHDLVVDELFKNVVLEELSFGHFPTSLPLDFLHSCKPTVLKGRLAYFFSRCGCHSYGHGDIKYITNLWVPELNSLLEDDDVYYNTCLLQVYDRGASIGHHADDEKCYINSEVKTCNIVGDAVFSIKRKGRMSLGETYEFFLHSGDSFTMGPTFQRKYVHSVKSLSEGRTSLTFRRQERDLFGNPFIHSCKYGDAEEFLYDVKISKSSTYKLSNFVDFDVPGDGNCFWYALGAILGLDGLLLKKNSYSIMRRMKYDLGKLAELQEGDNVWAEREAIAIAARSQSLEIIILNDDFTSHIFTPSHADCPTFFLSLVGNHFKPALPRNGCVVRAVSKLLNREEAKVLSVLGRNENRHILEELSEGNGIGLEEVEVVMKIFGVKAEVITDRGVFVLNETGRIPGIFELKNSHLLLVDKLEVSSHSVSQSRVTHLPELESSSKLLKCSNMIKYKPSLERAKVLSTSLLEGNTGVLSDVLTNNQSDWLVHEDSLTYDERSLFIILGTFGSGKSTLFKDFIKQNPSRMVIFVSPRKMLADNIRAEVLDKKKKSQSKMVQIKTFEVFLKSLAQVKNHTIIFDEIQLFPPGYIDLILLATDPKSKIFLTGDPCQSEYDSQSDRLNFHGCKSDIEVILENSSYDYNILSQRFRSTLFIPRLPCKINRARIAIEDDGFDVLNSLEEAAEVHEREFDCILVSSFAEKKVVNSYFSNVRCHTFGESTGLTYDSGMVLISVESLNASERRWLTALSRFRNKIIFINCLSHSIENVAQEFYGRVLGNFLLSKASTSDLKVFLPGSPQFKEGFMEKIGRDEGVKEDKLIGDPWLKTMINLGQLEDVEVGILEEPFMSEGAQKTHLPIIGLESIRALWVERIIEREKREMRIGSEVSEQFTDQHSKNNGVILTNAAERFEAIYPRHKGSDSVTFLMAVKKRLKFSNPIRESRKLRAAGMYGKFLLKKFLEKVKLDDRMDSSLFNEAEQDFFDKKVSKSAATIENHSNRSCSDWLADVALIFMKSQYCSKWDNRFRDAKAGQTLACFQHSVLCRFAPYMRYIEKKVTMALPANFYIHSGKGLDELNSWVIRQGFNGTCTESDYEAFDASQDQYTLVFELELMKYLQIPDSVINDYKYIKTHLGSKLGSFAIMRFTGEASTFLFNTLANMVFTFLKYDLNGKESICFAGDDMCANSNLRLSNKNDDILNKIKLKAKVGYTKSPTFCGWHLSSFGIFKKPQLVFERLCVARETNNLANCIDSYAIEVSYAYKLGELLNDLMDEEELMSHYSSVRFIVKNSGLLRSSIKELFMS